MWHQRRRPRRRMVAAVAAAIGLGLAATAVPAAAGTGGSAHRLPSSFRWESSGILISPKPDATHDIVSVKDPSVIRYQGQWVVYATTANTAGNWSIEELNFRTWSQAASAPQHFLDNNPAFGTGYRAAPEVFYFAPQHKWYLVYQTGLPSYSTTNDPLKTSSWSAPKNFLASMPPIIADNIGNGFWVDMWVICDHVNCYLFSSDDNGHLYRSQTTVKDFPNGFGNTVIAMQDPNRFALFEPRRDDPQRRRPVPRDRPLPPAVPVPGGESFRQRRLLPAAVAAWSAHPDKLNLLRLGGGDHFREH